MAESKLIDEMETKDDNVEVLVPVYLSEDSDDGFNYDQELSDIDDEDDGLFDDLDNATSLAAIERSVKRDDNLNQYNKKESSAKPANSLSKEEPKTVVRPSVVDDFIRNFFIKMKMDRSLNSFNTEWYELQSKGKLSTEDVGAVPDIYLRNEQLDQQVKALREELDQMKNIAEKAQSTWDKFRRERDFHRMHHKRIVQEKDKLIRDIKRLKKHYSAYEPTLEELKNKYELAMKEKMLMRLERDRFAARIETMEMELKNSDDRNTLLEDNVNDAPSNSSSSNHASKRLTNKKSSNSNNKIPESDGVNPYANLVCDATPVGNLQLLKTFKGHVNSISSVALHPKRQIVATASDDETWKMWSVPTGELIMSGEGHKGWVSDLAFNPNGKSLATSSGDSTVKLWDFMNAQCSGTLTDHTQAVWGVAWHHTGNFLSSCSMDHTAKLFDTNLLKCVQTFRGHVDSVNTIKFQPYTNNICTGSGDKTVSMWDIRTGLCVQTFYGHSNAVNNVAFNLQGNTVASCDADGIVKVWDVRTVAELGTIDAGVNALNSLAFDRSGLCLAAASDDGMVKMCDINTMEISCALRGHEDAVQCVLFDNKSSMFISGGSDCTFRIWQG